MVELYAPTKAAVREIELLGVASGLGAEDDGCRDGPEALQAFGLTGSLAARDVAAPWNTIIPAPPNVSRAKLVKTVAGICNHLGRLVNETVARHTAFAVIGGDHSCAVGTWNGVRAALDGDLGLIWIDAHMDSHLPGTSPSGNLHGMPLANLLGHGPRRLVEVMMPQPALAPANVCLVGVRSFEPDEAALLDGLGVRVMLMEEVRRRGMGPVMDEALAIVGAGTAGYGLSIDLDAIDPFDAPGVGTPEADGLAAADLIAGMAAVCAARPPLGVEIAEYSPSRDLNYRTAHVVADLLGAAFAQEI